MDEKTSATSDSRRGNLDEMICTMRHQVGAEAIWEKQRNSVVESHPYICGYAFVLCIVAILSLSHLMVFSISLLFLFFISDFMTRDVHRLAPFIPKSLLFSILYLLVILSLFLISYKVVPLLAKNFPELSSKLQTQIVEELSESSERWDLFAYIDLEQVKDAVQQANTRIFHFLLDSLTPIYKGFIQFVFALAINLLFYFEAERVEYTFVRNPSSLMAFAYRFIQVRLRIFYAYFRRVMGGQVIISLINTVISSAVIFTLGLPHPFLLVFIVFFCGLFPVIGNLISNSVLVFTAFVSIGIWGAAVCLALLISIHKLEYFLNSRIIGGIVSLPMAVSLAALVLSEAIFGIPGLILAIPLVLFIRHEFEHIPGFAREGKQAGISPSTEPDIREAILECTEEAARFAEKPKR